MNKSGRGRGKRRCSAGKKLFSNTPPIFQESPDEDMDLDMGDINVQDTSKSPKHSARRSKSARASTRRQMNEFESLISSTSFQRPDFESTRLSADHQMDDGAVAGELQMPSTEAEMDYQSDQVEKVDDHEYSARGDATIKRVEKIVKFSSLVPTLSTRMQDGWDPSPPKLRRCPWPFLPVDMGPIDFKAGGLCKNYHYFKRRLKSAYKGVAMCTKHVISSSTLPISRGAKEDFKRINPRNIGMQAYIKNVKCALTNQPLGEESFTNPKGDTCLAFLNNTCSVQLRVLGTDATSDGPNVYTLNNSLEATELVDFNQSEEARVLDFDVLDNPLLFALKYTDSVSLLKEDGEIVKNWKPSPTAGKSKLELMSVAFSELYDSVLYLTSHGSLYMHNLEQDTEPTIWERQFLTDVSHFRWGKVVSSGKNSPHLAFASRKETRLFDVKRGGMREGTPLYTVRQPTEIIMDIVPSQRRQESLYVLTSESLILVDSRCSAGKAEVYRIPHALAELPVGAALHVHDDEEYVFCYTQGKYDVPYEDGEVTLFSLKQGLTVSLPSTQEIFNNVPMIHDFASDWLRIPWSGMCTFPSKHVTEGCSIVTATLLGQTFTCDLEEHSDIEDDTSWDLPLVGTLCRDYMDKFSENLQKFKPRKLIKPTDMFERDALDPNLVYKYNIPAPISKETYSWTLKYANHCKKKEVKRGYRSFINEMAKKEAKKKQVGESEAEEKTQEGEAQAKEEKREKSAKKRSDDCEFNTCPSLKSIKPEKFSPLDDRISKIFEGIPADLLYPSPGTQK